ncbi:unnamed protein product, partial [Heterosigma akashiwo]
MGGGRRRGGAALPRRARSSRPREGARPNFVCPGQSEDALQAATIRVLFCLSRAVGCVAGNDHPCILSVQDSWVRCRQRPSVYIAILPSCGASCLSVYMHITVFILPLLAILFVGVAFCMAFCMTMSIFLSCN